MPEVPFTYDSICKKIEERERQGRRFTLIIAAEGAHEKDGGFVTSGAQEVNREARLGGIATVVANEVEKRTGKETRTCKLGHLQRGGTPTAFDRALCSSFGAHAVELIAQKRFGRMVAWQGLQISDVPISEAIGKLKNVEIGGSLVRTARALGISVGD
jgi:6-phosphofructokinase 1